MREGRDGELWAACRESAYIVPGARLVAQSNGRRAAFVGELPPVEQAIVREVGDTLVLHRRQVDGEPARYDDSGAFLQPAHVSCTLLAVFDYVATGELATAGLTVRDVSGRCFEDTCVYEASTAVGEGQSVRLRVVSDEDGPGRGDSATLTSTRRIGGDDAGGGRKAREKIVVEVEHPPSIARVPRRLGLRRSVEGRRSNPGSAQAPHDDRSELPGPHNGPGDVTLEVWDAMWHDWQFFAAEIREAREAIDRIGRFVRRLVPSEPG